MNTSFSATIAGIGFRFLSEFPMETPAELLPFPFQGGTPEEVFTLSAITEPVIFDAPPLFSTIRLNIYRTEEGIAREFNAMHSTDGCKAVCVLREDRQNRLLLPKGILGRFQKNCILSILLGVEAIFLRHDALLLHSSVVAYQGKTVLFCGAPGIGKSTQAALWANTLGAEIVNGDRCVIAHRTDAFYGCGSPYCGSSGILSNKEAPIGAILLLGKSPENRLRRLSMSEAFRRLLRELTVNTWDPTFMERCLSLLTCLVQEIPVYELQCRPDEGAVLLAKEAITKHEL